MRTRRRFRSRRVSEIRKTFDAAEALLLRAGLLMETVVGNGGVRGTVPLVSTIRNHASSRDVDDNNEGVTRLSAHALTQAFQVDWKGRCSIVYLRHRRDRCLAPPTEIPMVLVDDNVWIVDPRPLEWYGEALYTSTKV
ncbi:hypothetical protein Hanom_Chr07g00619001 [Helianthus anomalus]